MLALGINQNAAGPHYVQADNVFNGVSVRQGYQPPTVGLNAGDTCDSQEIRIVKSPGRVKMRRNAVADDKRKFQNFFWLGERDLLTVVEKLRLLIPVLCRRE